MVRFPSASTAILVAGWTRRVAHGSGLKSLEGFRGLCSTPCARKYQLPVLTSEEEKWVVRSPYSDVEIPEVSLADYVWRDVHTFEDNVALVCGLTGREYTYGMAYAMARKFGSALLRAGAKKGDVLGMVVPNCPEFPIVFLGACGVGLTVTTMNPTYRPEEIARQLENSGTRYLVTVDLFLGNIRQACEIYKGVDKIIVIGQDDVPEDCLSLLAMMIHEDGSLYDRREKIDAFNDIATLPYSSGTTGPPKGVSLTHYNLVANIAQIQSPQVSMLKSTDWLQEVTLAVLPFFHIYGMNTIMTMALQAGAKIVTLPRFEPEPYVRALVTYKPTWLNLVPPLVSFLATHPLVKPSYLESVAAVTGGAAPFGPALIQKFRDKCAPREVKFREGFGMTESSPVTHFQPEEGVVPGSCGVPVPNTIAKVVDPDSGRCLGPNEDGELCVAGPQVMKGYFKNAAATAETVVDGWLHTGDIARYDERGQFFIVDRLKELIKVKGLQVAPTELEDLIRRHPGVNDVAVVGVPDERAGELPRAYVVRKDREVTEQSIIDWVAERAAPHKKLGAGVMFVDTLPKNQTGKILRRELKAQVFKGSFGY